MHRQYRAFSTHRKQAVPAALDVFLLISPLLRVLILTDPRWGLLRVWSEWAFYRRESDSANLQAISKKGPMASCDGFRASAPKSCANARSL
jgi:hypothetical protein